MAPAGPGATALRVTYLERRMAFFDAIGSWISGNEALLSGLAALIVVATFLLSPVGLGLRRLKRRRGPERASSASPAADPAAETPSSTGRITLKSLTAPSPYETRFADSGGVRIAYNERGQGPPDIVIAPGIISHLTIMGNLPFARRTVDALTRFARVIAFDKRGQGLSDPTLEAPSLEERALDIEAVMDAAGLQRAFLMGVSEGGPMCLHFAHSHPERVQGLVLLGTAASWEQRPDFPIGIPRRSLERVAQVWGSGRLRDIFAPDLSQDEMDDATYRQMERLVATRKDVEQLVAMMLHTDVRALLPEIQVPTLVFHFTGDLAIPVRLGRAVADALPNAEFIEVNATDHADLAQSPEAIERIRSFCAEIERSQAPNP